MAAISRRAAGFRASIVYREVSTMTRPPGRVRCSDFTMKWLWMLCPDRLCRGSCSATWPNGTLPITRSNDPSGKRVPANEPGTIVAPGYRDAAIAAVTGSSSTPVMRALTRREADEIPRSAARLQYLAAIEAEPPGRCPHGLHQSRIGVVSVQRAPRS